MWVQLVLNVECSVELGFGFYWVRVSFFFSSDSRAMAARAVSLVGRTGPRARDRDRFCSLLFTS